tara:strand:- start:388 stop:1284 length:897 start_codon:yes stop_codon:yes gene_type:complete
MKAELTTLEHYKNNFTSHTFTNCGSTGQTGPTYSECIFNYNTPWMYNTDIFDMTSQGIQIWTVPETGSYEIEVFAASEGYGYSSGAHLKGTFTLTESNKIMILCGQRGGRNDGSGDLGEWIAAGAGGGTFVVSGIDHTQITVDDALIVAGGGGGTSQAEILRKYGKNGANSSSNSTDGGTDSSTLGGGSGGAGLIGDGSGKHSHDGDTNYSNSFQNGGNGSGPSDYPDNKGKGYGGFGGGGEAGYAAGGGGGGMSGGTHTQSGGNGGGSYIKSTATNTNFFSSDHFGHGKVIITLLLT